MISIVNLLFNSFYKYNNGKNNIKQKSVTEINTTDGKEELFLLSEMNYTSYCQELILESY